MSPTTTFRYERAASFCRNIVNSEEPQTMNFEILPRGATRLFHLIHRLIHRGKLRCCVASQERLAAMLRKTIRASIRSVVRWIRWLVEHGNIRVIHRPNQTSIYVILNDLAEPMAEPMAEPIKEEPSVLTPTERKQASRASSHFRELPPEIIETPGGRTLLNPEWQACRDALHASREAVMSARNREAYQRAIIARVREEWHAAQAS